MSLKNSSSSISVDTDSSDSGTSSGDENVDLIKSKDEKVTGRLMILAFLAAIGGFLFGYDTGVMSGAMISLRQHFALSSFYQELVVSGAIGAAAIFAILAGVLNDWLGRKPVILISSVVFTVGALVMALAPVKELLLLGRIIVGAGVGLASMTIPMYIAESSPPFLRGQLVTMNNLFITAGQFVASIVDGIFFYDKQNGWRFMLGLAGIPSLIQLITFFFMPESPRWLVAKNRREEARRVLMQLRGVESDKECQHRVEKELVDIEETHRYSVEEEEVKGGNSRLYLILAQPWTRRALLVGCGLQLIQQLAGINTVMYYSASIISMAGVRDPQTVVWLSAATAGVNMVFTLVGLYLVERWGRRPLTLSSLIGVCIALIVLAAGFQISDSKAPPVNVVEQVPMNYTGKMSCLSYDSCLTCISSKQCGFCYSGSENASRMGMYNGSCLPFRAAYSSNSLYGRCSEKEPSYVYAVDHCPSNYAWMTIAGLVFYLMCFAPGMGPMPWTINSEIYPLWARSTCISCATAVNWFSNLAVSITFLTLTEVLTKAGAFLLYVVLVILGIIFVAIYVPETKGKRLEEIEKSFRTNNRSPAS